MTKKVYLVTGPEGSGTYMMSRALDSVGVVERLRGARKFDNNYAHLIVDFPDLVWVHRSLPSAEIWPNLEYARKAFEIEGYEVMPIFMIREFNATYLSQKRRDPARLRYDGEMNIRRAFRDVIYSLGHSFIPVSYEAFVSNEGFRRWLFVTQFGLPEPTIEFRDENVKYYG